MALAETTKMKTMIGDLLAFNSFAVDAVPIKIETLQINDLVGGVLFEAGEPLIHKSICIFHR